MYSYVQRGIPRNIFAFPSVDGETTAQHAVSSRRRLKSSCLTRVAVVILQPCAACCRRRQEHCQPRRLLVTSRQTVDQSITFTCLHRFKPEVYYLIHKNSVPTSRRTQYLSITKINVAQTVRLTRSTQIYCVGRIQFWMLNLVPRELDDTLNLRPNFRMCQVRIPVDTWTIFSEAFVIPLGLSKQLTPCYRLSVHRYIICDVV